MAEELKIIIEADVDRARAGLDSVSSSAIKTGESLKTIAPAAASVSTSLDNVAKKSLAPVIKLQAGVSKLGDTIETLKAKSLARQEFIRTEKDVARIAILNKEIQALEAEIIRVQNIGKAGISFQSSGIVSGANQAFSALRKLAFILPGIGIAGIINFGVQAVSSLLGVNKEAEKTKDSVEELNEALKKLSSVSDIKFEASGSVAGEVEKVQALAIAVRNTNLSYQERKNAINELKEINKNYFGDLTLEASSLDSLTGKVEKYTQAIIAAAVVKGFQNQISKIAPELGKANKAFNDATDQVTKFQEKINKIPSELKLPRVTPTGAIIAPVASEDVNNLDKAVKLRDKLGEGLQKIRGEFADIEDAIHGAVNESLKFKPLTDPAKEAKKGLTELQRKTIELAKSLSELFNIPLNLKFAIDDTSKKELEKANAILKGIKGQTIRLNVIAPEEIKLPKAKLEIDKPEFKKSIDTLLLHDRVEIEAVLKIKSLLEQVEDLKKALQLKLTIDPKDISGSLDKAANSILTDKELQDSLKLSLKLDIDPVSFAQAVNDIKNFIPKSEISKLDIALEVGDIKTIGLEQSLAKMNEGINNAIKESLQNIATEGFTQIGEAIGEALSSGDIGNAIQQFGQVLGGAVEALGKKIIGLGVAALLARRAIDKFLFANPALAIAAGVALVAIGAALKNLLGGGLQGFAKGGRPPVGKVVKVGEVGTELFVADRPGTILTHEETVSVLKNQLSNRGSVVSSQSVKENENIKEYLSAKFINQQLKTIEDRLLKVVYKISEHAETTNRSIAERFTTHTEAITKFVQSSTIVNNDKFREVAKLISTNHESKLIQSTDSFKDYSQKIVQAFRDNVSASTKEQFSGNILSKISDKLTSHENITKDYSHTDSDLREQFRDKVLSESKIASFLEAIKSEKLTAYKLHEIKDKTATSLQSLKESFTNKSSVTDKSVLEKLISSNAQSVTNHIRETEFNKLISSFKQTASDKSFSDRVKEFENSLIKYQFSDKQSLTTSERFSDKITHADFKKLIDSFKESFNEKSFSLTDKLFKEDSFRQTFTSDRIKELSHDSSIEKLISSFKESFKELNKDTATQTGFEKLFTSFKDKETHRYDFSQREMFDAFRLFRYDALTKDISTFERLINLAKEIFTADRIKEVYQIRKDGGLISETSGFEKLINSFRETFTDSKVTDRFKELQHFDSTEKLISVFNESKSVADKVQYLFKESDKVKEFSNQFKNIIESSLSNSILSKVLQEYESVRVSTNTQWKNTTGIFTSKESFKNVTDKFTDSKLINVYDKLRESFINTTNSRDVKQFVSLVSVFKESNLKESSSEIVKEFFNSLSDKLFKIKESVILKHDGTSSVATSVDSIKISSISEKLNNISEKFASNTTKLTAYVLKTVTDSFKISEGVQSKPYENIFKQFTTTNNSEKESKSFRQLELFTDKVEHARETNSSFIEKFHTSFTGKVEKLFDRLTEKINITSKELIDRKYVSIDRIVNNNFYSTESNSSLKSLSVEKIQKLFNVPAFAGGGAVFGPTLAILGEGFGISRSHPEYVGTAEQLKNIIGGSFGIDVNLSAELTTNDNAFMAKFFRIIRSQARTTGKNPFIK